MEELVMWLATVAVLAAVMGTLRWMAVRARRRGTGRAVMSAIDELWHPTGHESYYEIRAQAEHQVPRPSPDDDLLPGWRPRGGH